MCLSLTTFSAQAAKWELRSSQTIDNGDQTVTIVKPYRYGPMDEVVCGGRIGVDYNERTQKTKLCRQFGFKSYVKDSVTYDNTSYDMSATVTDSLFCGGYGCCGSPVATGTGIATLKCKK